MARGNVTVKVDGDYNNRDIQRAISDLKALQTGGKDTATGIDRLSGSFKAIGATLATVFAADKVITFLRDSAQAALDDERSLTALNRTLQNLGFATAAEDVNTFLDALQRTTGVSEEQLRPAFDRLIRSTDSVSEAQRLLRLSLDASAGTGRSVQDIANALGRAYDGNTTALGRLGIGLDRATLKSGDLRAITAEMSRVFAGQADAAAGTLQGSLNRVSIAAGELSEAFGRGLVGSAEDATASADDLARAMQDAEPLAQSLGGAINQLAARTLSAASGLYDLARTLTSGSASWDDVLDALEKIPAATNAVRNLRGETEASRRAISGTVTSAVALGKSIGATGRAATGAGGAMGYLADETDDAAESARGAFKSFLALYESLALAERAQRDLIGTSGTVTSAIAEGARMGGVADFWKKLTVQYGEVEKAARGAGGGAKELTEKTKVAVTEVLPDLLQTASEVGIQISKSLTIKNDPEVIRGLEARYSAIKQTLDKARADYRQFAQDIAAGIMSDLDIGRAMETAREKGTNVVEEFIKQAERIGEYGRKLTTLLSLGLNQATFRQLASMSADRGMEIADAYLNGNTQELIRRTNEAVGAANNVATAVGEQSARQFYSAGVLSAVAQLQGLVDTLKPGSRARREVKAVIDDLIQSLSGTINISVATPAGVVAPSGGGGGAPAPSAPPSSASTGTPQPLPLTDPSWQALQTIDWNAFANMPFLAEGGVVKRPTIAMIGEGGPEAVVPLSRLGNMSGGGNTYNITVNTGVGDPRQIGQQIVEYVTRFEQANGAVYAKAS